MFVTQPIADSTVAAGTLRRTRDQQDDSPTPLAKAVISLLRRSQEELPPAAFALLGEASHISLREWLSRQYNEVLPGAGSAWDNVLRWAQLFVERFRVFEMTRFDSDTNFATRLAYGYVAMLLELGRENAPALMIPFSFFYETSSELEKVSRSAEVIINQEVKDQLSFALFDLLSLVAEVSTYFHRAISDFTSSSVSIDIRDTFTAQIEQFKSRCVKVTLAVARHVLVKEGVDPERVHIVNKIRSWLVPNDPVIAALAQPTSYYVNVREEMTCRWITPYLKQWEGDQYTQIHITGHRGSGKSILSSVILDHLHDAVDANACLNLSVSIGARIPVERTMCSIVRSMLFQIFDRSVANVPLLTTLGESLQSSGKITDNTAYDNLLWDTLKRALECSLPDFSRIAIVVDGVDEALCDERYLLQKLVSVLPEARNVTLITLGTQKPPEADGRALLEVTRDVTLDDISKVVRSGLRNVRRFRELPRIKQEAIVQDIAKASEGSFLWAKLASKHLRIQENSDHLRKAVDTFATTKPSIADMVFKSLGGEDVSMEAKQFLTWLAIAQRPLHLREIQAFASIQVDEKIVRDTGIIKALKPVSNLLYFMDKLLFFRHGMIRDAVVDLSSQGKLVLNDDPHADFVTRLFVYLKSCFEESSEPSLMVLDWGETIFLRNQNSLLDYASRYWPLHLKQTGLFTQHGAIGALEKIANVLPMSTTFIRFLDITWERLPTPEALSYHELVTELYRKSAGDNVVSLQCMISLALKYRKVYHDKATELIYETTMLSKTFLTERHIITIKLADIFLELSADQITRSHTEIMKRRGECLALLFEAYTLPDVNTSEKVVAARSALADHYRTLGEEQKADEVMASVQSSTGDDLPSEQPL
ncbi:hypothetical protein N7532_002986 [Penicillium argentinense]|uniref:Nephrocystin 3-like N-terminal domain-containing protein n=1 Tax=Penicillium argentinense TaxID=1131581 RepID=A0A9W9FM31_9EURO|nr:uncharacterized protein N7532_002986 [Penicillium argentinense]KAJ5102457.1 hypothetical protein N7532_002986 [Penicillium argentinense]